MWNRLRPYWPSLIAVLALGLRLIPGPRTIDDAYITYRYARNLLAGAGFVFNAGERVLGTTTPLYTLLLAGLAALTGTGALPVVSWLVNSAADALTCLLLARLGERLSGRAVGLAAALAWAVSPMSVTFAIGGMETSVFILLWTLTADLYVSGRDRPAALCAALLCLTRPDGLLFIVPLLADRLWRAWRVERRWPWAAAGIFAATLAPWLIFATLYFGSPLPHSIAAKALAYRLPPEAALVRLLQHYGTPFFEHLWLGNYWPLAGFTLYAALSLAGGLRAARRIGRAWPLAVYPWLYFAAFALANPLIFRWYLAPPLPAYFLFIFAGLADLLAAGFQARPSRWPARPSRWPARLFALAAALSVLVTLRAWNVRPDHGPQRPAPDMAWFQLELLYAQVGRELAPAASSGAVIAAGDVGALGYFSGARILDTVGLMSPEASAYYPLDPSLYVISYAIPPQLILDKQPDYVVLLEVYGRRGLLADARFQARYALWQKIPTDIYGSDGLLIFQRRP